MTSDVTQADRDAAARIWQGRRDHDMADWCKAGKADADSIVQAFARHRIDEHERCNETIRAAWGEDIAARISTTLPDGEVAGLVERYGRGRKGCPRCKGKGWHYVTLDPDLDRDDPNACGLCFVPADTILALQARQAALVEALENILCCTPANTNFYDCGDPFEIARAALNGEAPNG